MNLNSVERLAEPTLMRESDGSITISIPMRVRKYSGRQQIVLPRSISFNEFQEKHGLTILQAALARARRWQTMLDSGRFTTVRQLALHEKVDPSYVSRVMNLNLLCPEIVKRILDDDLDTSLSFNDFCIGLPSIWNEQMQRAKIDQVKAQDDLTVALPP